MASSGKVIGGTYMDSMISVATFGGGIVIHAVRMLCSALEAI